MIGSALDIETAGEFALADLSEECDGELLLIRMEHDLDRLLIADLSPDLADRLADDADRLAARARQLRGHQ